MLDNRKKTRVTAFVAPGSSNNASYDFDFSLWKPSDNSGTLLFTREFENDTDDYLLLKSIEELEKIILALFLCDSVPRKIYFFEYSEALSENPETYSTGMKFWRVFGQPRAHFESEQIISSKSFSRLGLFNETPLRKIDYVASESEIKSWFEFLSENSHIASSLQLIQASFGLAHELYAGFRIINFTELSTVLLLLVSGLEILFTQPRSRKISYEFRTVGAAFYSKYVSETAFQENSFVRKGKFETSNFEDILRILYKLRSSIAHGNFNLTFFSDEKIRELLDDLFSLVSVGKFNKDMKRIYFAHLLIALGILENHILEIFRNAKTDLNKGVKILDEI